MTRSRIIAVIGDSVVTPGDSRDQFAESLGRLDVVIPTGLGHGRNLLVVQADAVVAIGGGAGTLSEIAMAWMHSRLIIAKRGEGWAGRLADQRVDERARYANVPEDCVYGVDRAEEAKGRRCSTS